MSVASVAVMQADSRGEMGSRRLVLSPLKMAGPGRDGWEGWCWTIVDEAGAVIARSGGYFRHAEVAELAGRWRLQAEEG